MGNAVLCRLGGLKECDRPTLCWCFPFSLPRNLLQHLGVVKAFAVLQEPPTALPYVEQIARGGCCGWQGGARALSLAKRAWEFRIAIMRPHITQRKENSRGKLDSKKSPIASWELLSSVPGDLCGISSRQGCSFRPGT